MQKVTGLHRKTLIRLMERKRSTEAKFWEMLDLRAPEPPSYNQ
jgi:hypothetical protein